ncbi:hypothetical protein [Desulfovibrio legallii]|uniref:Uncharacterized protein n=1 Tax=Desulfovibrio legallii TaxID=571438 RepID=A0A6H3FCW9_9BACT|nr:hypothetical protein [Desulfovibrio legallii]RHH23392.1 hypothetical protein DW219_05730 [Desulfovibrio sp. AM18-2]TBH81092.1 hypothetical protein EB812_03090 [Desulfovibrio legallii]CAI3229698.1 hypothetical protein DWUX_1054 [Desulfovibrio diazotrophicus]
MGQSAGLLHEALELARQEMAAMQGGAYDKAVALAERRNSVTCMAWTVMEESSVEQCRESLQELVRLQESLTSMARKAHEEIKAGLGRSRRERRRLTGYRQAVGQALQ